MAKSDNSQEPIYFGIKKKAIRAWRRLSEGMDDYPDFPCKNLPYYYTDYDSLGFEDEDGKAIYKPLTPQQSFALCAECPIIDLCYDFAVANDETHGVWGGTDFGDSANKKLGKLF